VHAGFVFDGLASLWIAQPSATVPVPVCLLCDGPASPPSRMGWLESPERQAVFVGCGACSDCADTELEKRIVARISDNRGETIAPAIGKSSIVCSIRPGN
jgi:hypothetical protein